MSRGFKIAVGFFLGLLILVAVPESARLLIGWASFIGKVLPKIEVNWSGMALLVLCLALIAGVGHSFCRWLWRSGGRPDPWKLRWTCSGIGVIVLMFSAGMAFTGAAHQVGWLITEPPRLVAKSLTSPLVPGGLRAILIAQQEFREHDRDGNGKKDYWRPDVAGLHGLVVGGQAIRLLELPVAMADDRPRTDLSPFALGNKLPLHRAGYYFHALRFDGETDATLSPDRFAVCSIPSSQSAGSAVFILSDAGIVYVQAYFGMPLDIYPSDPEKSGWYRVE
jgi:hypothetical protein